MKERPILFSAPMVRAILDGRKTQTRRILKPQPPSNSLGPYFDDESGNWQCFGWSSGCPYGQIGDQLWVRETFGIGRATGFFYFQDTLNGRHYKALFDRWTPSIYMPRKASRIQLEITNIRVERLQDISREDSIAEGVIWKNCPTRQTLANKELQRLARHMGMSAHYVDEVDYIGWYRLLWESINGAESWAVNPYVWVIEFRKV